MFGFETGARVVAAAAVTWFLLAGCSSAPPPEPPAPSAPSAPSPVVIPVPPGSVPGPAAMSIAEASADPTKRFVLAAGEPAGCLESQGSTREGGATVLDGRAVLGRCRPVEGQAWSFRAAPDGTYRLSNRTRDVDRCFEGAPRVAPDGAANTACGRSAGQVWHVVATSAGFHRLRTDASGQRCLGVAPTRASGDGSPRAPGIAMVPCEPLERPPGAPRSTQDWELSPAPVLPEPPRPTTTPAPTTTARPRATATDDLVAQVNSRRAGAGCGPVRRDARLDRAAEAHARWMTASGEFSHSGKGGSSPAERIEAEGWTGGSGENIAHGQTSVGEVMTDWMNSPGHRRNILDCEFGAIGLARVGSADDPMWVQTFGGG